MKTLIVMATAALLAATVVTQAQNYQRTFRDASGRTTGTSSRDSNGTVTYRDASGRTTGTSSRDSGGRTTFRDASGRTTGYSDK